MPAALCIESGAGLRGARRLEEGKRSRKGSERIRKSIAEKGGRNGPRKGNGRGEEEGTSKEDRWGERKDKVESLEGREPSWGRRALNKDIRKNMTGWRKLERIIAGEW